MNFKLIMPLFLGTICAVQASNERTEHDSQENQSSVNHTNDQESQLDNDPIASNFLQPSTVQELQQIPDLIDPQQVQTEIDQKKAAFLRTNCPKFNIDTQNGLYILDAVLLEPKEFDPIFNQKIDLQQIVFMGMVAKKMLPSPIQNYADSLLQNQTQNNNQQNTHITTSLNNDLSPNLSNHEDNQNDNKSSMLQEDLQSEISVLDNEQITNNDQQNTATTTSLNDDLSPNLSNHEDNQNDNKSSMLQEGFRPEISVLDDEQITNNNQQNATMDDLFGFIKAAYEFSQKISSTTGTLAGYFLAGLLAGGTTVAIAINPKAAKRAVIQTGKGIIHAGKSAAHGIGNLVSAGAKALWQKIPGKAVTQAAVDLAANTASKAAESAAVAAATVVANTLK